MKIIQYLKPFSPAGKYCTSGCTAPGTPTRLIEPSVPVAIKLRTLVNALADRDLTYVLDPRPVVGYGVPFAFKAPLPH